MVVTGMGSTSCNNSIVYIVKNSNNPIGALSSLLIYVYLLLLWNLPLDHGPLTRLILNIRLIMEMGQ
jgi:hypothetical protein